ncbi:cytochrome c biogenesis protein CcdA [Herbiconiux moechotypicola]|uniref:Cytochrome c biogenesis protein CcdA n=1 Tax=Herbiconiux moechotypicola TaxID=637393 RepID=A0ABN3E008_9MICO|nr:cytochrome c biogenesis protein CcdA [Herbiconiux moechotypicola]MCS5731137.1 cytochrome c biogenesis protein CcdA [Herbiconiux moechotypicola]
MGGNPFAEVVLSGQLLLAIPVALLAGLVSFASPCVLPLVPGYLGYVGGFTAADAGAEERKAGRRRMLLGISLFILGFSLVFLAYSAVFGALGTWLIVWQDAITRVMGGVVIVLGLVFIGQFSFLQRTIKPSWRPATGLAGAPVLGIVFGLGWTPCIGPTLGAIQALSLTSGSAWTGVLLGFFYCIGLGVPFLLVALGFDWVAGSVAFLKRHIRAINIIGGALLVAIGVLMVTGVWTIFLYEIQAVITGFVTPI